MGANVGWSRESWPVFRSAAAHAVSSQFCIARFKVTTAPSLSPRAALRRDVRVIGFVGFAHCLSHLFQLTLAPLFPLIKAEFDVSYATLGALISVFYVSSGICQFGAGSPWTASAPGRCCWAGSACSREA